jgi:ferredoxin
MAGFFEFSLMRIRDDIDQKLLSELFEQYITVEDEFMTSLFAGAETQMGRVFLNEEVIPLQPDHALTVLDYDRASEVVKTASHIGVGVCYCRHKKMHADEACDNPLEICMTFNGTAESLTRHGIAKTIDQSECMDLLEQARGLGLVQFGENVRESVNYICNCCGCCCEALLAVRRSGLESPVHTTNYIAEIDDDKCNGCGKCIDACPVEAMTLVNAGNPVKKKRRRAKLDESMCLGCGVCVPSCNESAIQMEDRPQRHITPLNGTHRAVVMAVERDRLADLLFDDRSLLSHRLMGAMLASILKLPPVKRLAASRQVKSRYLESLVRRYEQANGTM